MHTKNFEKNATAHPISPPNYASNIADFEHYASTGRIRLLSTRVFRHPIAWVCYGTQSGTYGTTRHENERP